VTAATEPFGDAPDVDGADRAQADPDGAPLSISDAR
jgi:hypothetical protein